MGRYISIGMNLDQWLAAFEVTVPHFAGRIGVRSRNTVYRYIRGEQVPEARVMRAIIRETAGLVEPNSFYRRDLVQAAERRVAGRA